MNKQEAKERCEQLSAEHPDRGPTGTETRETKAEAEDPRQLPPWLDPPRGGLV